MQRTQRLMTGFAKEYQARAQQPIRFDLDRLGVLHGRGGEIEMRIIAVTAGALRSNTSISTFLPVSSREIGERRELFVADEPVN